MNEPQTALVPSRQETLVFYDDEITAVQVERDGKTTVMVPLRPLCDYLGVDWSGQLQRLRRDPVLADELTPCVVVTTTQGLPDQRREMLCLELKYLNGWLFGINANRVKEELRDKLIRYQREVYEILAAAFITTDISPASSAEHATLSQVRDMALSIAAMAEQQMALTSRLDKAAIVVGEHGRRITNLEQQLAPRNAITEEQAADVADKVKALANLMNKTDKSKSNYQQVFAELYRRFRVSSYRSIRQSQYQLVLDFLDDWHRSITEAEE